MYKNMKDCSDFTVEVQHNIAIITVNLSRATLKEAGEFKNILDNIIAQGFKKIIVDLHEVDFIDSTFLGALVVNLKKLKGAGGKLLLINLNYSVSVVVELTRLNKTFEIFQSKEEALNNI